MIWHLCLDSTGFVHSPCKLLVLSSFSNLLYVKQGMAPRQFKITVPKLHSCFTVSYLPLDSFPTTHLCFVLWLSSVVLFNSLNCCCCWIAFLISCNVAESHQHAISFHLVVLFLCLLSFLLIAGCLDKSRRY